MKMTYADALTMAIDALTATEMDEATTKAVEKLTTMRETYTKRNEKAAMSDEKKAELSAKRKEATAKARAEVVGKVAPILRKYLDTPVTAKELFEKAKGELPADFTSNKVQNILIREMKPELVRTERKKGGDTYHLI